jgi:hypothetical protein
MKHLYLILLLLFVNFRLVANEGMWIPSLLKSLNEDELYSMGLEIPVEELYSVNNSSIKDAIVLFGGGCTAEVVSKEGLIFTNHHCGFSQIQSHSTLEHDYLKNGFWAANRAEELPNKDLTATFIVRIEDVTTRVLDAMKNSSDPMAARKAIMASLAEEAGNGGKLQAEVKPFNYGNSYFMIVSKTYRDVRLVGAPPSAIGKFGGDTDNWVWPRHTGDFSVFRIYANAANEPADYDPSNVPYKPAHALPVSLSGVEEGDFCMVYGFPGRTEQFLISSSVKHLMDELNPVRIEMRDKSLSVINAAMRSSDELRIKYADTQSSIANAWKKWIGQNQGLAANGAIELKLSQEQQYRQKAQKVGKVEYVRSLDSLIVLQELIAPYTMARNGLVEFYFYGPSILGFARNFETLSTWFDKGNVHQEGDLDKELDRLKQAVRTHFRDYDKNVDREVLEALLPLYLNSVRDDLESDIAKDYLQQNGGDAQKTADWIYSSTLFADSTQLLKALGKFNKKTAKLFKNDPGLQLGNDVFADYNTKAKTGYDLFNRLMEEQMQLFVKGLMELFPDKTYWFDANSTLRLAYGKVEGSSPWDGEEYHFSTTSEGILQKYRPGDPEFDLPSDLLQKLRQKDFGVYARKDGKLPVCFTGSIHTTGGNSGSPAINGKGELVGINFDRSWESTMSDVLFDPNRCRNMMVDVRYVLWVIDKYAGASHLLDEMNLVLEPAEEPEMK